MGQPEYGRTVHPNCNQSNGCCRVCGEGQAHCNASYPNIPSRAVPFQYEKLRDILAFTQIRELYGIMGSQIRLFLFANRRPAFQKYFAFKVGGATFYINLVRSCVSDSPKHALCLRRLCKNWFLSCEREGSLYRITLTTPLYCSEDV
jgi:hypothetical protein